MRTNSIGRTLTAGVIMMVALVIAGPARCQDELPQSCTDCHKNDAEVLKKASFEELLANSIHKGMDCTDCHESVSMAELDVDSPNPHGVVVSPVVCGECHEDQADIYVKHGRLEVGTDPQIPTCSGCHGAHDILPSTDKRSRVHPNSLWATCNACHTDVDIIKDHHVLRDEPIKLYEGSVHGRVAEGVSGVAATCTDCHSADSENGKPTAHRILSAADRASTVHHFNVPNTCGRCHLGAAEDYGVGIHGQLTQRGEMDAPVCTHCHGEHGILPVSDLRSPVSAARLAEATCAPCHESVALNERFGIPAGPFKSYVDSYHGHKKKAGEVHVANCASCHGGHRILPHTDTRSSIHPANLQDTCGQCHPGISSVLAQTPIHGPAPGADGGWPRFFAVVYKWLIGMTIGLMLLHNLAHWFRQVKLRSRAKQVVRLTAGEVGQHWILMLSFTVLVISGFSLRFSDAWWVQILFGWGSGAGFVIRGTVHRVAGIVFMIWAIWHVWYLCTRRGRQWLRDMIGSKRDLLDIKTNALFFLGRCDSQPRFGRFSYMEKSEYWALMWGAVIMAATGVVLWFENYFIESWNVTKVFLDVAQVIHYYEAWLATVAILVWHIYATVFSPSVYPMNPAWWAGKMPKAMYDEEHPEGPRPSDSADGSRAAESKKSGPGTSTTE